MSWLISAPKVWPTASSNAGRKRLPPAKTLQRIAWWTFSGAAPEGGSNRFNSTSTSARLAASRLSSSSVCWTELLRSAFIPTHVVVVLRRRGVIRDHGPSLIVAQQHFDTPLGLA